MKSDNRNELIAKIEKKAHWVRMKTLEIHKIAPETRLASSLSDIELFTTLYYGKIINHFPNNPLDENRDRFIISKGHGSISMYPILADLGFFDKSELKRTCQEGSFLAGIPDPIIPGYETVNGSLGHGLGVATGIALALKKKKSKQQVFVLVGDGELYEGSNWEAIMLASHHKLNNLTLIIDYNHVSMLDYCKNIINLEPLDKRINAFNWYCKTIDGHNIEQIYSTFLELKNYTGTSPRAIIAKTIKGKGVPRLENNSLSHIITLSPKEIDEIISKEEYREFNNDN